MSAANPQKAAGELLKRQATRFARDLLRRLIYIAETLPRNENGKALRDAVRQKAQSGV